MMILKLTHVGDIAIVTIDNPPVNALNRAVRAALWDIVPALDADPAVAIVILTGAGKMFVGGADITEFERPVEAPNLPDLIARIETAATLWAAAMHGVALGGGLEIALGCRWRVAGPGTTFALPEVGLGIIPGAGGSQRLPRLIGAEAAIPVVAETLALGTDEALKLGLLDRIIAGDLVDGAIAFAHAARGLPVPLPAAERPVLPPVPEVWTAAETSIRRSAKGAAAPLKALGALRFGVENGFAAGIVHERETFLTLRGSDEAAALRYLFFAERAALRPDDLRGVTPQRVTRLGVIGGGTMGVGIVAALRNAGLPVVLVEQNADALARAMLALGALFDAAARRGGMTTDAAAARMADVQGVVGYDGLAGCDLVIEAVFEDLAVKRAVFAQIAAMCAPDAILATNTSYIDPRAIAEGLPNPSRFIGLHFFSPAQVMKLLEIVPVPETRAEVVAAGFALARQMGKIPVRSGICDGFIGNRILRRYRAEAEAMLRAGVTFAGIDAAMRSFGYAMGPFEMQDLAGLDISYMNREAARARGEHVPETPGDILVRAGRKGQKTGGGWYDYVPGDRMGKPSANTAHLLAPVLPEPVALSGDAIVARLLSAMASEGQAILDEGIAATAADIDLVEVHGYGFPRKHGGPMFHTSRKQP